MSARPPRHDAPKITARRRLILSAIAAGRETMAELVQASGVDRQTARNDLDALETGGLVRSGIGDDGRGR